MSTDPENAEAPDDRRGLETRGAKRRVIAQAVAGAALGSTSLCFIL
ncbi:hypothetical protein ABIA38_007226 [Embleya sp. AB8]